MTRADRPGAHAGAPPHSALSPRDTLSLPATRSPLRAAITAAYRRPEPEAVPPLLAEARLPAAAAAAAETLARRLAQGLRDRRSAAGREGLVQGLLQEYSLSSQEGVALMCLAEALLRIPDAATRDALIRDKIGSGDWHAHLGKSPSLFVNAATWGLLVTGKLVATHSESGLSSALDAPGRQGRRAADPQGRRPRDAADGRAVRHRRDDRRGARQRAAARGARAFATRTTCSARPRSPPTTRSATCAPTRTRSTPSARASAGRGVHAGPGISIKLSALHPRYSRAQRDRVLRRAVSARCAELAIRSRRVRHRPQHRRRGSRSPRALARPARARSASSPRSPAGTASASSSRPTRSAARS